MAVLLAGLISVHAEDKQTRSVTASAAKPNTPWNTNSWLWQDLYFGGTNTPPLRIGRSDFSLNGPLVQGWHPAARTSDRSLGQKILGFPIVNLVVPQRLPEPSDDGGGYFAWRVSRRSWTDVAAGAAAGNSYTSPELNHHEPQFGWISLGW